LVSGYIRESYENGHDIIITNDFLNGLESNILENSFVPHSVEDKVSKLLVYLFSKTNLIGDEIAITFKEKRAIGYAKDLKELIYLLGLLKSNNYLVMKGESKTHCKVHLTYTGIHLAMKLSEDESNSELALELATIDDARDLFILNEEFNGVGNTMEHVEESLIANENEIVCIARKGDEPVGFISGYIYSSMCYLEKYAVIAELYVREQYRNNGIGHKLIDTIENEFRERGITAVTLETDKDNTGAQKFYMTCGYAENKQLFYYKDL
jgi:ribosomal protein S18 acetylase RimI-like enzyme